MQRSPMLLLTVAARDKRLSRAHGHWLTTAVTLLLTKSKPSLVQDNTAPTFTKPADVTIFTNADVYTMLQFQLPVM
jgi:hypothetical protein